MPPAEVAPPLQIRSDQPQVVADSATPRILLAEDNPINQKIICNLLKNLGYTADVVPDGLKAVRALEIAEYDLGNQIKGLNLVALSLL